MFNVDIDLIYLVLIVLTRKWVSTKSILFTASSITSSVNIATALNMC